MKFFKPLILPLFSLLIATLGSLLVVVLAGESPSVFWEAVHNTLFTSYGLGYSLFYTTPLIFTGLSVAVAYHCGLFNIGAEGQLYIGSLGVVVMAALFPHLSPWVSLPLGLLFAGLFAGAYGGLVGFLKTYRGSHEVIVTILLNFIAYSIVDYCILYKFRNPESQNPESFILGDNFHLRNLSEITKAFGSSFFDTTPVNTSLGIALLACLLVYGLLFYTTAGFELRSVGKNPTASRYAGISVGRNMILAFALSGCLAGWVGINEVMGNQYKLIQGFSPGYGFTGIAVAMIARNHPLGIIFSAFLFGAFHNCARELEFASDKITKEFSLVIQGILICIIAVDYLWRKMLEQRSKKGGLQHG